MRLSIVAAMSEDRVIGKDNRLPWHMPADLKQFKKITSHKPVLMGRKTWESIGRPLPNRTNIVISRSGETNIEGAQVFSSIVEALAEVEDQEEVMVIGGAELYRQFLPLADRMYLTYIHGSFDGDVRFPDFDPTEWKEKDRKPHPADENNAFCYTFLILDRIERV